MIDRHKGVSVTRMCCLGMLCYDCMQECFDDKGESVVAGRPASS